MSKAPLLKVEGLVKHFPVKGGILGRTVDKVHAVDGVSFTLQAERRWAWWVNPAAARAPPAAASCA